MSQVQKSRSVWIDEAGRDKVRLRMAELKKSDSQDNKRGKTCWTPEYLAPQAHVSFSTVKRLLRGIPIDRDYAISIFNTLGFKPLEFIAEHDLKLQPNTKDPNLNFTINWQLVCQEMLQEQQEELRFRRRATEQGFEVRVYVPLGLVERKQQQRRSGILPMEEVHQLEKEVIIRTYKHDEFLNGVIGQKSADKNKHIAIVGEPGAGKTTLLDAIATHIQKNTEDLPICISLGSLQGKKLKDYILEEWLPEAIALTYPDIDVETFHHNSLQKRLRQGGVWLLLDGVDEMGEISPAKALESIQNQLTNWLGNVRVVLTCRTNVWDANLNNRLSGFDTYKTQHFELADIRLFIKQWFGFAGKPELGKILRQKLNEPQRDRIRQLVENPLRLALLCQVFHKDKQAELPETKAALYELFVRYFYEWKPTQSSVDLTTQPGLKEELHQALGRLSIAGLDGDARFRLPENLIQKEMGDRLFKLAWELGWLNLVDREARTDEPVYAFFHPTFQEYFAALAIDDWHFFLNHDNENPNPFKKHNNKDCVYRIFERQWKEVILLWLGRPEEQMKQQKEKIINNLVDFEDGCGSFYSFYYYRAYFLASSAIAEFSEHTLADQIVREIVYWNVRAPFPIRDAAREVMKEIEKERVISALREWLDRTNDKDEFHRLEAAYSLLEIDSSNQIAINALIQLIKAGIPFSQQAADVLARIGKSNQIIINSLEQVIQNHHCEQSRTIAALCLAKINPGSRTALEVLVQIIQNYEDKELYWEAAYILAEVDPNNQTAILSLIELVKTFPAEDSAFTRNQHGANNERLNKITNGVLLMSPCDYLCPSVSFFLMLFDWQKLKDYPAAINALVKLLETTPSEYLRMQAAERLGEIDRDNQTAIITLVELIQATNNENIRCKAASILGKIGKGNQTAIAALMQMLENPEYDLTRLSTAYNLGLVDPGNSTAINFLVNLIQTTDDIDTFIKGVSSLVKIDPCNETAISFLLEVVNITKDEGTLLDTFNCLWKIKSQKYFPKVVTALKGYLKPEYLKNPAPLFEDAYYVIWHCAQNMSYPDFYRAWHNLPPCTHPEAPDNIPVGNSSTTQRLNFTQLPSILRSAIAEDEELNQAVQLICIDGSQFSDQNNPATDIYIEMVEQGCPEQQEEPSTMQQLKKYWRLRLKNLEKRVALLFYNSKADREFSETCLTALSTFGGAIAIITTQRCENVKLISPNDPDLIDAVLKWLRRDVLES